MLSAHDPAKGAHNRVLNGTKYSWNVSDLWALAAGLPVFQVDPNAIIDLEKDGWFAGKEPVLRLVLDHVRRIQDADMSFPVILDPEGSLMDGAHRVAKAILEGRQTIAAVQFPALPAPSRTEVVSCNDGEAGT